MYGSAVCTQSNNGTVKRGNFASLFERKHLKDLFRPFLCDNTRRIEILYGSLSYRTLIEQFSNIRPKRALRSLK